MRVREEFGSGLLLLTTAATGTADSVVKTLFSNSQRPRTERGATAKIQD
jgi:hypothetical protein